MLTLIVPPQAVSLSRTFYLGSFDILAFGDNPGLFEKLLGKPFFNYFIFYVSKRIWIIDYF